MDNVVMCKEKMVNVKLGNEMERKFIMSREWDKDKKNSEYTDML